MHVRVEQLLKAEISPVYLIMGASILVDRALDLLEARVAPLAEPASFNRSRWRGGDGDGAFVLSAARTLPMMAQRRLIRVDRLEAAPEAWLAGLHDVLEQGQPSTVLLLGAERFPKVQKGGRAWATVLPKAVERHGQVLRFTEDDADPVRFVMTEVRALGATIDAQAARLMVELTGTDLSRLLREAEKVSLASDGGSVDAALVAEHCASVAEPEVWGLTQGIASKRVDQALGALHRLLADGEAPHKLLALVLWQLRQVLRLGEMIRNKRSEEEMRSALRMRNDLFQALRRELEAAPPGAASVLAQVARANRAMNRVRAGDDRVLETLVLALCQRT